MKYSSKLRLDTEKAIRTLKLFKEALKREDPVSNIETEFKCFKCMTNIVDWLSLPVGCLTEE